jgi:type II secretory pathway pseudopilin PulG
MKLFTKNNDDRSFTLTEVLVVITIIVILITIIIVATEDSRALARDKQRMNHFAAYKVALQEFYSGHSEKYYEDMGFDVNRKVFPFSPVDGSPGRTTEEEACKTDCPGWETQAGGDSPYDDPTPGEPDSGDETCTCLASVYLPILNGWTTPPPGNEEVEINLLDPLPMDPIDDIKDEVRYKYFYTVKADGKEYKLWVPLEKDQKAMENDGGDYPSTTFPDAYFYEVFSTLGAHLAVNQSFAFSFGLGVSNTLICGVEPIGTESCSTYGPRLQEWEITLLRLSDSSNAHAALPDTAEQDDYPWAICCLAGGDLTTDCSGTLEEDYDVALKLSSDTAETNMHVGDKNSSYTKEVCIHSDGASVVKCGQRGVIGEEGPEEYNKLCSISDVNNAHAAGYDFPPYMEGGDGNIYCAIR